MSAQFGKCNFDGKPVEPQELVRVRPVLAPHGPDAESIYRNGNLGIIYRAFHTTKESRRENQPHVSPSGAVITWEGRLDNRLELIHEFQGELAADSTDVSVVASAYEKWGTDSFAKLIGDWALSIWNPRTQSLVLAKDFVGTRHLCYSIDKERATWSTLLDPLVLFAERNFALCSEYLAGCFSFFPAAHLTPYVGIHSVPASSFVLLRRGTQTVTKYWDFDCGRTIRYRTDSEYEEHFRDAFGKAVGRRLRSDSPVLAELSGGMDSSSIVCVADTVIARGAADTPRLDTVSYYSDSEPNWNERPYFTKVEEKRGRTGCHISVGTEESLQFETDGDTFAATPGSIDGRANEARRQFAGCMEAQGNRVVLSGTGGDEVTGGVPTPIPELMDLLATAQFKELPHELKVWALNKRRPWFHLFFEAVRGFLPPGLVGVPEHMRPARWLHPSFAKHYRAALTGYPSRVRFLGPLPSFQENLSTLDVLRRQLACSPPCSIPIYEKRYPYLDRTLLEFLYAIPREQLVRPGHRRSLMRRALVGIVPDELLNRKRKAFVSRGPMAAIRNEWDKLIEISHCMMSVSLGIVDSKAFCEAIQSAHRGQEIHVALMMRTIGIESWLRTIRDQGVLIGAQSGAAYSSTLAAKQTVLAEPLP